LNQIINRYLTNINRSIAKFESLFSAILGMRLSVAFRKREFIVPSLKAAASQRIEISRKEQQEQKNNKCQPHQKFIIVYWSLIRAEMLKGQYWPVIPDRSLTGSGIQGNALKNPVHALIAWLDRAISFIRAGTEAPPLPGISSVLPN
jgi:hypothetical protein